MSYYMILYILLYEPMNYFSKIIMVSGIAHGHECTMTTKSHNMAAILQLIDQLRHAGLCQRISLILDIHIMVN